MKVGDVMRIKKFRHNFSDDPKEYVEYDAGRGHVFKFILVGREPIKGDGQIDPNEVLRSLGWETVKEK